MAVYYITVRGGSVPSYQVLAAHLHVHAALFTQEALAKHMTDRSSAVNRLPVLTLLLSVRLCWTHRTVVLLGSSENRGFLVTCFVAILIVCIWQPPPHI